MKNLTLLLVLFIPCFTFGQTFPVSFDTNIEIIKEGKKLALTDGFNSPQFSTLKVDNDDLEDLFIFDRTTNQVLIFLQKINFQNQKEWIFAPEYTQLFPKLRNWVLLRDYDGDGQRDIFASTTFGIIVYKNTKNTTGNLTFEVAKDLLFSTGIAGNRLNLGIDATDIPAILDLDNDGDMDILNFRPSIGTTVEWHKNLSQETYSISDSLIFEKETIRWGGFEECVCESYIFDGNSCRIGATGRVEHAGSSLLVLNLDDNPALDLLVGDVACNYTTALFNEKRGQSANTEAILRNPQVRFPASKPIEIPTFAAVFYEDVTFDGNPDLIAAPNLYSNDGNLIDYENSAWLYENKGTKENPSFEFVKENFLQEQLFDIGENARPALIDIDNDGDLDMIVGERGHLFSSTSYKARLHFLENIGSNENPKLQYKNDDYLNFASSSTVRFQFLKPIISDFNGDEKDDLLFTAFELNTGKAGVFWIENKGNTQNNNQANFSLNDLKEVTLTGINLERNDEIILTELNNDDKIDLLVLQNRGGIKSFLQQDNGSFNLDNQNFGNLSFTRGSFTLYERSENGQTSKDLLLSNPEEGLFLIKDFKNQETGFDLIPLSLSTQNLPTDFPSSLLTSQNATLYFGNTVFPVAFDSQILIGTVGGGLQWLSPDGEIISGIDNDKTNENLFLKVFPNPAKDILTVQTKEKGSLILYDTKGQLLIEKQIQNSKNEIDISRFAAGLYILVFNTEKGQVYQKVIVQK
ncbi:T9SS type A sorting domain-containing protein [Bernardetia sp. ABR2-2B]|uniref:T9SS type A sorting domain-containing protein n=1 Tax=Bernardetia sp. ABR2-2B TaxID=3127472 RepID=UPI0030CDA3D9